MSPKDARKVVSRSQRGLLYHGNFADLVREIDTQSIQLVVTSPPYFIGKSYDRSKSIKDFEIETERALDSIAPLVKEGGSICWQVGNHIAKGEVTPLDFLVFQAFRKHTEFKLRNRIVWSFGHGTHAQRRFSGRHETILWFTKGNDYHFDLDAVRVPQKYPGKRHYKGPKKGELSGNPLGKNPGDVWDIPNVKARHIEKTNHPCQFPVGLVERLVNALTNVDDLVFDPFIGSGTTAVSCELLGRRWIGADTSKEFCQIAAERLTATRAGTVKYRRSDIPVAVPNPTHKVATIPDHFWKQHDQ